MSLGQRTEERQIAGQTAGKRTSFLNSPYAWVAIYLLALNIRFWFNFQAPHMNAYGACDASEYLRNATVLHGLKDLPASFWVDAWQTLTGQASQATQVAVRTSLVSLNELKISSPVFPVFLIASFFFTGTPFDTSNWMLMLGAQSFIAAFTCVLIAHTAALVFDRKIGFCAGILSAIYPGFIVNSGRLYSETFATFLITFLVWLVVKDFIAGNLDANAKPQNKFTWTLCQLAKGLTAICLQLTRSIMVAVTLSLIPLTILTNWKSKAKLFTALALMVIGYAAIALPWLALQKIAFGNGTLIVDRVGHYNFFIGNNVEGQGWLSVPYQDGRGIEEKSLPHLLQEAITKHPSGWMKLMSDKLPRLLKFPWNDFRTPIGPIGFCQQITVHQITLLLGALGIVLSLFGNVLTRSNRVQIFCRLLLASLIVFQLVYCFFITVPRYNLAIMPFIIMFAGSGLITLWRMVINRRSTMTAVSVIAISVALFSISRLDFAMIFPPAPQLVLTGSMTKVILLLALAVSLWQASNWIDGSKKKTRVLIAALCLLTVVPVCLPVRAHGRLLEWQQVLHGETIKQTITVSNEDLQGLQSRNCYLLIDCEGQSSLVNNAAIRINGRKLSSPFIPSLSFANDRSHVLPTSDKTVSFEQEYIFDCLTKEAGIANADLRQWFLMPIPKVLMVGIHPGSNGFANIPVEITGGAKPLTLYGSQAASKSITIPSLTRYSWEKAFYGVENTHGLTDTRYDQRIDLKPNEISAKSLNAFLLADDSHEPTTILQNISSDGNTLETAAPNYRPEDLWLVRVTGQSRGKNAQADINLVIDYRTQDGQIATYQSPWCSRNMETYQDWHKFDCSFPLKPSTLPGKIVSLKACFLPVSTLSAHINTKHDMPPAEVEKLNLQVFHLKAMPFDGNYKLYLGQITK